MCVNEKENLNDFMAVDSPVWAVRNFLELLERGDIKIARRSLTLGLQNGVLKDDKDLKADMAFLMRPEWSVSARRMRNDDGTEVVRYLRGPAADGENAQGKIPRTTYPFLMTKNKNEWLIASLGKESLST